MSEVRVKSWPLAVVGSMMLHATVATGVYLIPATGGRTDETARLGGAAGALADDATPIYLLPDELPPDVADHLKAERELAAKTEQPTVPPKEEASQVAAVPPPPPKPFEPVPIPLGVVNGEKINTDSWL